MRNLCWVELQSAEGFKVSCRHSMVLITEFDVHTDVDRLVLLLTTTPDFSELRLGRQLACEGRLRLHDLSLHEIIIDGRIWKGLNLSCHCQELLVPCFTWALYTLIDC